MAESGEAGQADSYIGSLISLTSKSEIRYEGLLYTVDTEDSNIALQNVRSFGTEGRKKDGPQIPASDKIYEFIIFRGTDIKDLQVKMSPPPSIHSDPAIISAQAQVSQPVPVSTFISPPTNLLENQSTYKANSLPYYHTPTSGIPLWAPPLPPQVPTGSIPYYWQGFYRPQNEHRLLEPSSGIDWTPVQPQVLPALVTAGAQSSSTPAQDLASTQVWSASTSNQLPPVSKAVSAVEVIDSNRASLAISLPVSSAQPSSLFSGASPAILQAKNDVDVHPLKPDNTKVKLLIEDGRGGSHSSITSLAAHATRKAPGKNHQVYKQVYRQVQVNKDGFNGGHRVPAPKAHRPVAQPLLLLPILPAQRKPLLQIHGGVPRTNSVYREGGHHGNMGRASKSGHSRSRLLEDFDFIAMNEKFKKEEVWDELLKVQSKDQSCKHSGAGMDYGFGSKEIDRGVSEISKRSVYVKDDFFDSLSCDALEQERGKPERLKFSEQRRLDVETFGSYHIRTYRGRGGSRGRHGGGGRSQNRDGSSNQGSYGHGGSIGG